MRIMLDTNVLISASLFGNSKLGKAVKNLSDEHTLVLCSTIIDELHSVYNRKFPDKLQVLEEFLNELSYVFVYTPTLFLEAPQMRDVKDIPILASAIIEDVDILITGDKDFADVEVERPEILTPTQFLEIY